MADQHDAPPPAHTRDASPPPYARGRLPQPRTDFILKVSRARIFWLLLLALLFVGSLLLHLPVINLPYYWDEAGYFVPAARDIYAGWDFVPHSTLSNAHPPLVMTYLALAWRLCGFSITAARAAMLLVSALALLGVFRLSERVANRPVAWATTLCTALYPVFFAQSSLAHLDMTVAALTLWGLVFYLPRRDGGERLPAREQRPVRRVTRGSGARCRSCCSRWRDWRRRRRS